MLLMMNSTILMLDDQEIVCLKNGTGSDLMLRLKYLLLRKKNPIHLNRLKTKNTKKGSKKMKMRKELKGRMKMKMKKDLKASM